MKTKIVMVGQQHFTMAHDPKPNIIRIRIDHTPEEGEPMYDEQHVLVLTRPLTEEEEDDPALADLVPTEWITNPMLCQLVEVSADIDETELRRLVQKQHRLARDRAALIKQTERELTPKIQEFEQRHLDFEVIE